MTIDEIIDEISSVEPSIILSSITLLEIQGIVRQIDGVFYNS